MCLYTKYILNPKYKSNKKNGGKPPVLKDERVKWIPVACGKCIECRRAKAREWKVRIQEECRHDKRGIFVTLTFNEEKLENAIKQAESNEANTVATKAIRMFLERWRKKYKESVKHWLIPELGHKGTERLHLHGILWTEKTKEEIEKRWQNGYIVTGYSMGDRCINYITKYITKNDIDRKEWVGKIHASPGIGKNYINSYNAKKDKENGNYRLNNGSKVALPIYFRNKLYTEDEREKMWIERIEEDTMYVCGEKIEKISTEKGEKILNEAIEYHRKRSEKLGYKGGGKRKKTYYAKKTVKNLEMSKEDYIFEAAKETYNKIKKHKNENINKKRT